MENHYRVYYMDILNIYLQKVELKGLHCAKQQVFAEETADGKITVTLVKAKSTNSSLPKYGRSSDKR